MSQVNSCGGCPRKWTGQAEAHCSGCHLHFTKPKTFDMHRIGHESSLGRCVDPCSLKGALKAQSRESGTVWGLPGEFDPARFEQTESPIRTWARPNGYAVGDRGRIAKHVQDAYVARQSRPMGLELA